MSNREHIPKQLRRDILIEAGHRCAIPVCQNTPVEIAHIISYSQVQKHEFHNLICLCPTCHTRYDRGEIDKLSMQQYKSNISVINHRYGSFEKRILKYFANNKQIEDIWLPGLHDIHVYYLLEDGLLFNTNKTGGIIIAEVPSRVLYKITERGKEFIDKWVQPLDLNKY